MGPTNLALVALYRADQQLRAAQGRLEAATKNLRVQERRVHDLEDKLRLARQTLREQQTQAAQLDLDLKSRDARLERLRTQQQNTHNNKEYQAFLVEINTEKVDRNKVEERAIKELEQVERGQASIGELNAHLQSEQEKLATMKAQMGDTVAQLQREIDDLRPAREQAAEATAPRARAAFDRLADRFEGEAMAPLGRPNKRHEEYVCTACHMDLVTDVYNRLHSRDDLVTCPSCQRILFIPEDLTLEAAINQRKEKREPSPRARAGGAAKRRQSSAVDVARSIQVDAEDQAGQ